MARSTDTHLDSHLDRYLVNGFHDPIADAQSTFRQLLKAMSEPGTLVQAAPAEAMDSLYGSTFALCQTLLDQQTSLWLSPRFCTNTILRNLHFHTGVNVVQQPQTALFALAAPTDIEQYEAFLVGNHEYPEQSCTLLLQVDRIQVNHADNHVLGDVPQDDDMTLLSLTGPGIKTKHQVALSSLSESLLSYLSAPATFPLGLDFIFVDPERFLCLSRTTNVEVISCTSQ
ncbi:phosphonate C-P lyase system protein PhnH [Marinomonas agarivorans]|nr:phosphonate C-P lyase system protein PhnH [Marinomonas agarivorans]